ncbi:hypothetical protein Mmc1_3614 [Magnetococcus marinus MC-1]|uniref:MscS Mechanosensitive ion channel n=1 Tax=Magnetococcus marinus (strain ATCC BAA-1437 / JCM 17883 / MC-1) TaxID=156889 RepID=A0LDQ6_MAGMM|nr:hypothetical protein [Magnetococcus marinus]ABK46099.1 hypothetical protein Mmc1_3614 [Magnetococcus marinus MC-1]
MLRPLLLLCWLLLLPLPCLAQDAPVTTLAQDSLLKLNEIHQDLMQRQQMLAALEEALKQAKTDKRKELLKAQLDESQKQLVEQERAFEMIMTGGETLIRPEDEAEKKKFDWQNELLEIVQPIMSELRKLTEQQRKRDNLNKRIEFHESRLATINGALEHLQKASTQGLSEGALARFKEIQRGWQNQRATHQHLLGVNRLQLVNLEQDAAKKEKSVREKLHEFLFGRGLTLILALGAALAVYLIMGLMRATLQRALGGRNAQRRKIQRVMALSYQSIAALFALIALFYVFNMRGDRALQAVAILIVAAMVWLLRTSVPGYVREVRLLLNLGEVREGERIHYKNLPWAVVSLNLHTTLRNPCVQGELLHVPLSVLLELRSRPFTADEAWFPCAMQEYILLPDGQPAQVMQITDEQVRIRLEGGAIKTYDVPSFLATQPVNLSHGFAVETHFGVDYHHLNHALTQIPQQLEQGIKAGLLQRYGEGLLALTVQFERAADSSLDYRILAQFTGSVAARYTETSRDLQGLAVECAITHGWQIPYRQLVIHQL